MRARTSSRRVLGIHRPGEPLAFRCRQPRRLFGPIGQDSKREDAEDHGWQALDGEQPLPSVKTQTSVEREQRLRHRCADDDGDGGGGHEQSARAGTIGRPGSSR